MNEGPIKIDPTETPDETFKRRLAPPCDAYLADIGCEWKATSAAHALNDFTEWVFVYCKEHGEHRRLYHKSSLTDFRTHIIHTADLCPDLQFVWDIALGKHRFVTIRPELHIIHHTSDAFHETGGRLFMSDIDRYFDDVARHVYAFWHRWLGTWR